MHWIDVEANNGQGEIVPAGKRGTDTYSIKGNTVMFDVDKIFKVGGATSYGRDQDPGGPPAKSAAYVIDISGAYGSTASVSPAGNLTEARIYNNSVVLPNGQILVTGGLDHAEVFADTGAALSAELYDPYTDTWTTLSSMQVPRTYHSVSILMPDGRVFVGGGGLCDQPYPDCTNHDNAEIFSPPYLFDGTGNLATRPVITGAPATADYNTSINVLTDTAIDQFSLVRFSAVTHSTNNEQRRIPVSFTGTAGNYALDIADRNILPPGYYMLFALDANGVPSQAATIQIGNALPYNFDPNLVLDMGFEDGNGTNVSDASSYGNNGTIVQRDDTGNPATVTDATWQTGLNGGALEMDGLEHLSNALVDIPYDANSLGTISQSVTMSAWVFRDATSVIPQNGKVANVAVVAHEYPSLFFGFHNTLYKWSFHTSDGAVDCYAGYDALDGWNHIAATYDGTYARLFVNGVEVCSKEITGDIQLTDYPGRTDSFTIGGFYDEFRPLPAVPYGNTSAITDELDGRIDELKIWNRVLQPSEIRDIYTVGVPVTPCPANGTIVAEYKIGSGAWQDVAGAPVEALEGQEVYLRAKGYGNQYFVTTTEVDGPTFDSTTDLNAEGAYQIDTGIAQYQAESNDGLIDQRSQGQYALSTAGGCPTVVQVNVTPSCGTPVPAPWQSQDIGAVGAIGVSCESGGVFEVRASGADIWGSADEFHFVYRELTGNGEIIARVTALEQT
ncbi:galactose oxidase-like domain-containing protein, partial [Maribacter sp. CXY002]|uniref:galactose oxidase-like domain-containing protein n=1 Tax=Maribacter luteocoastalis TaxID=3407671 RepID=UPI003B6815FB